MNYEDLFADRIGEINLENPMRYINLKKLKGKTKKLKNQNLI